MLSRMANVRPGLVAFRSAVVRMRPGITLVAVGVLAWRWWLIVSAGHEWDAGAYWWADPLDPYHRAEVDTSRAYLYSPAFVQAIAPVTELPWREFHAVWTGLNIAALVFLLGPIGAAIASFLPLVADELLIGNIHLLLAASIVVGFRHPAAWSLPLLTKVLPGVGLVWFAMRREWRSLALAVAVTVAIVLVSVLIAPRLWLEWIRVLSSNAGERVAVDLVPLPLVVKVALATAIVAIAAVLDRRWLVPFAAFVALPVSWFPSLSILLAAFPLMAVDARRRASTKRVTA